MAVHFKLHVFSPKDVFTHALRVQFNFGNDSPNLLALEHYFRYDVGTKLLVIFEMQWR